MRAHSVAAALGAAAVTVTLATQTSATPADGPYLRLEGGLSLPHGSSATSPDGLSLTLDPRDGPIAGAAAGMRLAPFRLEIDVDWMHATLSGNATAAGGRLQNIPVMMNGLIDIANASQLEPYFGVGLGVTSISVTASAPGGASLVDSSTHAFAFQPIVGVNFNVTDQLAVGVQYRYFKSVDPGLKATSGQRFTIGNASHNVLATVTYHFFAPQGSGAASGAPAVVPAVATEEPAPALGLALPAQSAARLAKPMPHLFLVFFDFNSAKLTAAGRRSADEVIISYQRDPSSDIEVRGYTDLVGSDSYNLDLSKRRAMTVYEYFAARGVKPADMGIDWLGKANPRVDTPKREPQNRRVEIEM